ncbi:hypothetical protein CAEBREN_00885 [Caenorhabditis brenneri]|uniref:Uncharacterized protein n=1 Tax=Caenorhabditis brenneri TaxID=135651 RepID=G0P650_CAEBE|nr:hypothetical protein CAEBREN_00885 [Caenorhabditis brenneri]
MWPIFLVFFGLVGVVGGVKPVWKTPVSEPNPNANVEVLKEHSNLAKRAQPNYYTRPEQVSIPDYRPPPQRIPPSSQQQKYQQVPPHQLTSGGSFRPFAWVGPQPKAGSPQTSYYEKSPNKGQFPNGLPPLPPNWQQYPVQMIWIPDTPGQTTGAYPYYPGPGGPIGPVGPPVSVSTGSYGLYGPTVTTEEPMKPSAYPETYTGTLAHSPAVNPISTTVPYEPPNPYGGRQTEVSPSIPHSSSSESSYPATAAYETPSSDNTPSYATNPFEDTTNPYDSSSNQGRSSTPSGAGGPSRTVNPTIRPGPQEPSGGGGSTPKTTLPYDADETRDREPGTNGGGDRDSEKGRSKPTPSGSTGARDSSTPRSSSDRTPPTRGGNPNRGGTPPTRGGGTPITNGGPSTPPRGSRPSEETTPFEMTTNPFSKTIGVDKTVPPIYLGSDEEDEEPPEDISKVTDTPESSEHTQIPGSPGSRETTAPKKSSESETSSETPESTEADDEQENDRENGGHGDNATPTPQQEEEEMMKNFFPRPVSSQAYQPPGHQPEDFTSHINVNFKKPKGKGGCVNPPCRGVDTDKISLYKPDRDNEGSGPTLVISNAAKDDASRAGYKPAPPPVNPYIPPPPPPHPKEEYATPYTVPPGKQPFPPFGGPATPPRSLIPAHNFPPPSTFPPDEDYHETTTDTVRPTAQTISTRFTPPPTTTTPRPVESTTTEEDTPEYVPPAIVHMTASTPRGKNPPTYVPLHPITFFISEFTKFQSINCEFFLFKLQKSIFFRLDETKIEEEPSGYILEYGETGTRIQTADKKYEYRWCESSFEDKGIQQEYMEEAYDFIQKIRPGPLRHIKICPTWRDRFRGIIPRKCNVLSLGTDASMYTDYDMEMVPDCGKLDIAALLQCIDFQKGLALNGPKVLKTAHSKILSIDWLRVANCQWMRTSHLESFRNKCIYLSDVKFMEKEVNEFLWNFKEGFGNENLEVMTLKRKEGEWWNREEVLDQFNVRHVDVQEYSLRG